MTITSRSVSAMESSRKKKEQRSRGLAAVIVIINVENEVIGMRSSGSGLMRTLPSSFSLPTSVCVSLPPLSLLLSVCLLSFPLVSAPFPLSSGLSWLCSCGPLISVKGFGALKCFCFRCQEPLSLPLLWFRLSERWQPCAVAGWVTGRR